MKTRIPPFPVIDMPEPPAWEAGHAAALKSFLASEPGQRFVLMLNWQEQACNRSAVMRPTGFEHNCGYAKGWSQACAYILHQLSATVVPPQSDDEPAGTDDALASRDEMASHP